MPSRTYELIARAITERQQLLCSYQGHPRVICPAILGHTKGQEYALVYQFAGRSSKALPPDGEWKCFQVSKMTNVELRGGEWHTGASHRERQSCVEVVDLDVNPFSPYEPRRPPNSQPGKPRARGNSRRWP